MRNVVLFFSVFLLVLAGCSSSPSEVIIIKQESGGGVGVSYNIPMVMKPVNGEYVGNILTGALTTQASSDGRQEIGAFIPSYDYSIDYIGVSVSTAVANSKVRVLIFASDDFGRPTTNLLSSTEIDSSSVGTKFVATDFNFTANTVYWLGTWTYLNPTVRVGQAYSLYPTTWTNAATPIAERVLAKTIVYNSTADAGDWNYVAGHHGARNVPLVLMRVSA